MQISRWLSGCAFLGLLSSVAAFPEEAPTVELKTMAVAAFKNGLGFVVRQGEVRLEAGMGKIAPLPSPTLGTLWITPNNAGASLDEVVAYRYKVSGQRKLASLGAVLAANAGKTVKLVYDQKEISGEIVALRDKELPPGDPVPVPYSGMPSGSGAYGGPLPVPATPEYLLLKSDGRLLALHLSGVMQAALPADTNFYQEQQEERKALRFKIKGGGSRANLTMGYLEQGLGWTPSYLVSLKSEDNAQITMQAVLVNDAEDLVDTGVFFVVGVPNFVYSGTPSPMALQQSLLDFMQAAARRDGGPRTLYSNTLLGQKAISEISSEFTGFNTTIEELSGAPEEDLFLYSRSGITLARGERGTYNVFSDSVNYEHLYEWEVQDQPRVDGFGNVIQPNAYPGASDSASISTIWHSIRLKNSSKFPWTSAPALVISGTNPVSQDTLPYTPKGASSNLRITIATDLRSSQEERETARQPNIERRRSYNYDLVTVEGTLKVKNFKTKEVRLSIVKTLRGDVEFLSDEGKAVKLGEAIQTDNPMSRLTWEVTLKPGAEKIITYRYKIWLRV